MLKIIVCIIIFSDIHYVMFTNIFPVVGPNLAQ